MVSVVVVVGGVVVARGGGVERFGLPGVGVPGVVGAVNLRHVGCGVGGVVVVGGLLGVLGGIGVGFGLRSVDVVGRGADCASGMAVVPAVGLR